MNSDELLKYAYRTNVNGCYCAVNKSLKKYELLATVWEFNFKQFFLLRQKDPNSDKFIFYDCGDKYLNNEYCWSKHHINAKHFTIFEAMKMLDDNNGNPKFKYLDYLND